MQGYPELAEAFAKQNTILAEKLQEKKGQDEQQQSFSPESQAEGEALRAQLDNALSEKKRLAQENEFHLKSIELLSKQIDLYKSKSSGEVDRKIALYESKAKQEAKDLKHENDHLKEMMKFREDKIATMQQEIDRLRVVMKTEMEMTHSKTKDKTPQTSSYKLERKIDEIAQTGKIEYKVFLKPESPESPIAKEKDLEKIMSLQQSSLAQTLYSQGKILEANLNEIDALKEKEQHKIREVEEDKSAFIENMKAKMKDLGIERARVEAYINHLMEQENKIQIKFLNLLEAIEKLTEGTGKNSAEVKQRIGELQEEYKTLRASASESNQFEVSESPLVSARGSVVVEKDEIGGSKGRDSAGAIGEKGQIPLMQNIGKAHQMIDKCIEEQNIQEAVERLKEVNYEVAGQSLVGTIQKLQLACRVRDKQIQKLCQEMPNSEVTNKCMELNHEDVEDALGDFEMTKEKYAVKSNLEAKQQNEEIASLKSQLASLQKELEKSIQEKKGKTQEAHSISAQITTLKKSEQEARKLIKEKEDKINELQELLSESEKTKPESFGVSGIYSEKTGKQVPTIVSGKKTAFGNSPHSQPEVGRIQMFSPSGKDSTMKPGASKPPLPKPSPSPAEKGVSHLPAPPNTGNTLYVTAIMDENARSKALVQELMAEKGSGGNENSSQLLYANNIQLDNKIRILSESLDEAKGLLHDLSIEHANTFEVLRKIIVPKEASEDPLKAIRRKNREESIKKPSSQASVSEGVLSEIQVAKEIAVFANKIQRAVNDGEMEIPKQEPEEFTENARKTGNDVYKKYFVEEKGASITIESLFEKLKQKNASFKELYKLYEEAVARIEELGNQQKKAKDYQRESPVEKSARISVKQSPSASDEGNRIATGHLSARSHIHKPEIGEGRRKIVEDETCVTNRQFIECKRELERSQNNLEEEKRVNEQLEFELKQKVEECKQLGDLSGKLQEELEKVKSREETAERSYSARGTGFDSKQRKYDREGSATKEGEYSQLKQAKLLHANDVQELSTLLKEKSEECNKLNEALTALHREYIEQEKDIQNNRFGTSKSTAMHPRGAGTTNKIEQDLMNENSALNEELCIAEEKLVKWQKVLSALKELPLDKDRMASPRSRLNPDLHSSDPYSLALSIIDDMKRQLSNNRILIESLQQSVNKLQGERQLQYQTKLTTPRSLKQAGIITYQSQSSPKPTGFSSQMVSPRSSRSDTPQLILLVQKYERWFDEMQEPLKQLGKFIEFEYDYKTGKMDWDLSKPKLSLKEMKDIITLSLEIARSQNKELKIKAAEVESMSMEVQKQEENYTKDREKIENSSQDAMLYAKELDLKIRKLNGELQKKEEEIQSYKRDQTRLESQIQKQREENYKLIEKTKADMNEKEKESLSLRLEKVREEGIISGQKQQRNFREEELYKMAETIKSYKIECSALQEQVKGLSDEKTALEEYNKKANDEVMTLVETLKQEQGKQRQLSEDLEMLTREISHLRKNQDNNFD